MNDFLENIRISAFLEDGKIYKNSEINRQVQAGLDNFQISPNQLVVFSGEPSVEKLISILVLMKLQISWSWISDKESAAVRDEKIKLIGKESGYEFPGAFKVLERNENDLETGKIILFTSGSQGQPKAVLLSPENFLTAAQGLLTVLPLDSEDCWLLSLPCYHVSGLVILFRAMLSGCAVCIPTKINSAAIKAALKTNKISHISVVPAMLYEFMLEEPLLSQLSKLKLLMLGGAAVNPELLQKASAAGLRVGLSYGMTESAAALAFDFYIDSPALRILPPAQIEIKPVPGLNAEATGQIVISSPALAAGYLGGEKIAPVFYSQDIGMLKDGSLTVIGRLDRLINSGGEKIIPEEIENLVLSLADIKAAAVIAQADAKWGQRPILIVESEKQVNCKSIFEFLKKKLPAYKLPDLILMQTIPRLANGKIDYPELVRKSAVSLDPQQ